MATHAIETHELTKCYKGDIHAVDELELTVRTGEVYGFLGPNGAGKSTTIDMLLGVIGPTSGSATVLGYSTEEESLEIRRSTGFLPGEFGLYDRHTAREHVRFALDCKARSADPDTLLERVGLADVADQRAGGFSTGMKRRLALAMALSGDPELLILDEPTRGLDPNGAREVRSIVLEEVDRGATVFFSSHSMEQVEAVCDRVGVLRDGRLIVEDTVDVLMNEIEDHKLVVTVDTVPDGLRDRIEQVQAVSDVSVDGTEVTVAVADAGSKAAVINAVESAGAAVGNIYSQEPSLEEFFAAVTTESTPDGGQLEQPVSNTTEGEA